MRTRRAGTGGDRGASSALENVEGDATGGFFASWLVGVVRLKVSVKDILQCKSAGSFMQLGEEEKNLISYTPREKKKERKRKKKREKEESAEAVGESSSKERGVNSFVKENLENESHRDRGGMKCSAAYVVPESLGRA